MGARNPLPSTLSCLVCIASSCGRAFRSKLEAQLQALPHWNGGRNHILLDMTDSRAPWFNPGNAILWKSGYDRFQYRDWLDVSFPLLPNKFCTNEFVRRSTERPILLSFKVWCEHSFLGDCSLWLEFSLMHRRERSGVRIWVSHRLMLGVELPRFTMGRMLLL
jgi:hypothetical protein